MLFIYFLILYVHPSIHFRIPIFPLKEYASIKMNGGRMYSEFVMLTMF